MIGGGDSGGNPHVDITAKLPTEPINEVYVLVVTHSNGGEGIYGQIIGNLMVNFVTESLERKSQMESMLHQQGTYLVAEKMGLKLEWRTFS